MSFTSPAFIIFLPFIIILLRILPKKARMPFLLASSYFFYAYYDVRFLILILLTTTVSYFSGRIMNRTNSLSVRKCAIAVTILVCIGTLIFFKYFNFFLTSTCSILNLFGISAEFSGFAILLPMGISFYTFQTMSYCFDVYSGKVEAETNFAYYALFIVFFPQLVAGPIERPKDLLPQLHGTLAPQGDDVVQGLRLLLRGYAKKILIADTLALFVNTAYSDIAHASGAALLAATIFFAFQIYCDFSGYTDIARGCALFLGIHLSNNFNHPYRAVSIRDFWSRWHMSLTRWFRDYLYIPLGGNRKGCFRQCVNILLTFLVSGLWHGANITYLIWGGIHGVYLILETLLLKKKTIPARWRPLGRILTFVLVCFAWIFFRAPSLTDALYIITSIFTRFMPQQLLTGLGASSLQFMIVLCTMLLLPYLEQLPALASHKSADAFSMAKELGTVLIYFVLILTVILCRILILTTNGSTSFIYFQF